MPSFELIITIDILQRNSENVLVRRSQPYRNARIISVIRDLYFTGGVTSFAKRFERFFPTFEGYDGVLVRMVPVPMVALVATAVSGSTM